MRVRRFFFFAAPVAVLAAAVVLRPFIMPLTSWMPGCTFRKITGLLCPACGGTHAVHAMLYGRFAEAAGYNILPFVLPPLAGLRYAEYGCLLYGRHITLLPRKRVFWIIFWTILSVYFIARNFMV